MLEQVLKADFERAVTEAKKLLQSSKANAERPVNLATILTEQGLSAQYNENIEEEALLEPNEKIVYVKKNDMPITRKLFSIAHEIGHWILHSRDRARHRIDLSNSNNVDPIAIIEEQEANAFAAELLMPYDETRKLIILGYNIEYLMQHFNVSYDFANYRYMYVTRRIF